MEERSATTIMTGPRCAGDPRPPLRGRPRGSCGVENPGGTGETVPRSAAGEVRRGAQVTSSGGGGGRACGRAPGAVRRCCAAPVGEPPPGRDDEPAVTDSARARGRSSLIPAGHASTEPADRLSTFPATTGTVRRPKEAFPRPLGVCLHDAQGPGLGGKVQPTVHGEAADARCRWNASRGATLGISGRPHPQPTCRRRPVVRR